MIDFVIAALKRNIKTRVISRVSPMISKKLSKFMKNNMPSTGKDYSQKNKNKF